MREWKFEFMNLDDGEVLVVGGDKSTNLRELPQLVDSMFRQIHTRYPQAFAELVNKYSRSRNNPAWFKYLCVRRFVMCNFGEYDLHRYDIDEAGRWNLERVHCPLRGECSHENIICRPVAGTCLSAHEMEIATLLCEGIPLEDIAAKHNISIHTVRNHRRNIYRKLGIRNRRALFAWYNNTITR